MFWNTCISTVCSTIIRVNLMNSIIQFGHMGYVYCIVYRSYAYIFVTYIIYNLTMYMTLFAISISNYLLISVRFLLMISCIFLFGNVSICIAVSLIILTMGTIVLYIYCLLSPWQYLIKHKWSTSFYACIKPSPTNAWL